MENVLDVAPPAAGAVEVVLGAGLSGDLAANRNLRIGGKLAADAAIGVVEHQFDDGDSRSFAVGRAVEDQVALFLATQLTGG